MHALRITGTNHNPPAAWTFFCLPFPGCLKAPLALDKLYAAKNYTKYSYSHVALYSMSVFFINVLAVLPSTRQSLQSVLTSLKPEYQIVKSIVLLKENTSTFSAVEFEMTRTI